MRRFAIVVALVGAVASCSDSNAPDTAHVGLYLLATIDGEAPPVTVVDIPEGTIDVTGGTVSLAANGTFRDSTALLITTAEGSETDFALAAGTYTRSGNVINFAPSDGGQYSMTLTNNTTLTQFLEGTTWVYVR